MSYNVVVSSSSSSYYGRCKITADESTIYICTIKNRLKTAVALREVCTSRVYRNIFTRVSLHSDFSAGVPKRSDSLPPTPLPNTELPINNRGVFGSLLPIPVRVPPPFPAVKNTSFSLCLTEKKKSYRVPGSGTHVFCVRLSLTICAWAVG